MTRTGLHIPQRRSPPSGLLARDYLRRDSGLLVPGRKLYAPPFITIRPDILAAPAAFNIGVNSAAGGGTVSVTVPGGGAPAGASIVAFVVDLLISSGVGTVTDNGPGNSYGFVQDVFFNGSSANGGLAAFVAQDIGALSSGKVITYTSASSGLPLQMACFYVTGVPASGVVDTSVTATTFGNGTSTSVTTGLTSGLPGGSGELFVGATALQNVVANLGTITFTQDNSAAWATPPNQTIIAGTNALAGGSLIGSTDLTYSPSWSWTNNAGFSWVEMIIALVPGSIPPTSATLTFSKQTVSIPLAVTLKVT